MDSIQKPGTNDYDLLGLGPHASEQEIESAFDRLVRRKGFRQNLPRRLWRERLTQIESAYATLRDPEKRRAYDDFLRQASDSSGREWKVAAGPSASVSKDGVRRMALASVLVGAGSDGASDSLITEKRPRRRNTTNVDRTAYNENGSPGASRSADSGDALKDAGPSLSKGAAWSGKDRRSFQPFSVPVKHWAIGAVMMLGVGGLLLASWPDGKADQSPRDGSSTAPRTPQQIGDVARSQPAPLTRATDLPSAEALNPQERAAAQADEAAATAGLRLWADANPGVGSANPERPVAVGPSPQFPQQAPPLEPSNPSVASAQPTSQATKALAPAQSAPRATPPGTAVPPPTAIVTRPSLRPMTAQAAVKAAAAPATWISGGPTDKDNRRGRYEGTVSVRFTVELDGRLSNCITTLSSGNADLDALTCRILVERGRFSPANDAQGRPIASLAFATYVWGHGQRPKK